MAKPALWRWWTLGKGQDKCVTSHAILKVLPVLEATVCEYDGWDVIAAHAEALIGCYGGGYAAQSAIPNKYAWQPQGPPQITLHAFSALTLHLSTSRKCAGMQNSSRKTLAQCTVAAGGRAH